MKLFIYYVKTKRKFADIHSCGHIEKRITSSINGGWQSWTSMAMNGTLKLQKGYGGKTIIGCVPNYDPEKSVEGNAADFVKKYYRPDKTCTTSNYGSGVLSEAYAKPIYKYSREIGVK